MSLPVDAVVWTAGVNPPFLFPTYDTTSPAMTIIGNWRHSGTFWCSQNYLPLLFATNEVHATYREKLLGFWNTLSHAVNGWALYSADLFLACKRVLCPYSAFLSESPNSSPRKIEGHLRPDSVLHIECYFWDLHLPLVGVDEGDFREDDSKFGWIITITFS